MRPAENVSLDRAVDSVADGDTELDGDAVEREMTKAERRLLAFIYARLGQPDRAFEWLERGVDQRSDRLLWLAVDPRADPLRGDPRFAALVAALQLPAK